MPRPIQQGDVLINMGDLAQARRELARLYADDPTYEDHADLLEIVKAGGTQSGREPIPERVRHAVWRRDEGRCVQCGGQKNLEFDHIIQCPAVERTPNATSSSSASRATGGRARRFDVSPGAYRSPAATAHRAQAPRQRNPSATAFKAPGLDVRR